ncbi:(2Fe-2S) ferredoxin domain-containing protein [Oxynema aestuarii]|jgi:(2Fe-2S) ferredoxin|uniref:(2Fe-2S) ferredoxin domain-containing protein n=1 Tax=Oxynema aestuarii AP17 TaxID=2064643 RepID=A0A6H1TY32_9CYAN|nr:(2Fe-2S) ferredoxin domain-containing protein [Oxynema aestuarii]QIZ70673.1 (2Fe-2S) ferredoxin domain-containing protein [Oxynema aestuarii AP17]
MKKQVFVCQNRCCRQYGSDRVLAAFQRDPVEGVTVKTCGCTGHCGNGPMVLVEPDGIWYWRVHPDEVPTIIERHLRGGQPVKGMLYPKVHHG